jgi:hypothetical protein
VVEIGEEFMTVHEKQRMQVRSVKLAIKLGLQKELEE